MQTRVGIYAIVACVGLAGCMTTGPSLDPRLTSSCDNRRVCAVPVTVVECAITIPADKTVLTMSGKPIAVLWYLTPLSVAKKYAFDATKGVALKAADPDAQFPTQEPLFNNLGYLWVNRNTNYHVYDYTINVVDNGNGGRSCPPLDPKIYNQ